MPTQPISADLNEPLAGASQSSISYHYDIGRDAYAVILNPMLVYSAACWDGVTSLEDA